MALRQVDLFGLQTLGSGLHHEGDAAALIEGPVAGRLNGRKMDENVFAILSRDESKSFSGVKPLYCSCFFHSSSVLAMEVLMYRLRRAISESYGKVQAMWGIQRLL